jgi:hypothetical protein
VQPCDCSETTAWCGPSKDRDNICYGRFYETARSRSFCLPYINQSQSRLNRTGFPKNNDALCCGSVGGLEDKVAVQAQVLGPGFDYRLTREGPDMDTPATPEIRAGKDLIHG